MRARPKHGQRVSCAAALGVSKLARLVIAVPVACGVACAAPPDFIIFKRPNGGTVTVSRTGIQLEGPPDRYAVGAFEHIESYVSRLLAASARRRSVSFFTPAGDRGFALDATDARVEAHLSVEWRDERPREAAIRGFFASRGLSPTEDYLAGNGDVPDATRLLAYPLAGSASEVTAITKRILQELCGVSPGEALDIGYTER
jgi:hypothetical protein